MPEAWNVWDWNEIRVTHDGFMEICHENEPEMIREQCEAGACDSHTRSDHR